MFLKRSFLAKKKSCPSVADTETKKPFKLKNILKKISSDIFCFPIRHFKNKRKKKFKRKSPQPKTSKSQNSEHFLGDSSISDNESVTSFDSSGSSFSVCQTSQLETAKKFADNLLAACEIESKFKGSSSDLPQIEESKKIQKLVNWEIEPKNVKFGECVGKGAYGTVYKCQYYGKAAVKIIHVTNPSAEHLDSFLNEVSVLQKLRHEYILLFMGCVVTPFMSIVTEWCDGSSLYKRLYSEEFVFEPLTILYITRQLAEGMAYLHAKSIIHCDLKSNNVFMMDVGVIKIGDFGLAAVKTMVETSISKKPKLVGSVFWMAPEIIRQRENCGPSYASDVYAFGIVVFELITGRLPHSELDHPHQILYKVGTSKEPINLDSMRVDLPQTLAGLVHRCCHYDAECRPIFGMTLKEVLNMIDCLPRIKHSVSDSQLFF